MPSVVISKDGQTQAEYKLDKERTVVGRHPDADLRLDDPAISGEHAEIVTLGPDAFLQDLGSTNGTYINSALTKKAALQDGDLIGIGNHILTFRADQALSEEADFEKTMVIRPGMPAINQVSEAQLSAIQQAEQVEEVEGAVDTSPGMKLGRLKVLTGPLAGKELALNKALVTLGRPGIQVAVISRRPRGYFLTHIEGAGGSQQYPKVNGEPTGPAACALEHKDEIELAGVKMEFLLG